jgi:hypothetical protein
MSCIVTAKHLFLWLKKVVISLYVHHIDEFFAVTVHNSIVTA